MKTLNKAEQIAHMQRKDVTERRISILEMLIAYTATPHPATGVASYETMKDRDI